MPQRFERPIPVVIIAMFQFAKAAFLIVVAAFLWLDPDALPHSDAFSQLFFIAAHGRNLPGLFVPIFGLYFAYIGVGLMRLRKSVRLNLAISSVITICVSIQRLGLLGETNMTSQFDHQTLYILILLDLTVYFYLAFHPEITRCFNRQN